MQVKPTGRRHDHATPGSGNPDQKQVWGGGAASSAHTLPVGMQMLPPARQTEVLTVAPWLRNLIPGYLL